MKTLEKDRNRRYATANGFAADVQRYLNDEPVQACPPSVGYRLRKFAPAEQGSRPGGRPQCFLALLAGLDRDGAGPIGGAFGAQRRGPGRIEEANQPARGRRPAG